MKKHWHIHPFKANMSLQKDTVNKEQLRIDVKQATTEYLKTKTIQYQNGQKKRLSKWESAISRYQRTRFIF